jgi:hypothetical protein
MTVAVVGIVLHNLPTVVKVAALLLNLLVLDLMTHQHRR